MNPIGEQPKTVLIRRGDIVNWLGIPAQEFDKVVRRGLIPHKVLYKNGRKWFKTEDIKKIFIDDFRCR
jgi:hypothetical protein